jgi:Kef-type K+ transport system membrane component KefB
MTPLLAVGIILLAAIVFGHLFRAIRLPEVTGYIAAGVLVGPSVLGLVNSENVQTLHVMSEIALGIILFSIGTAFKIDHLLHIGRKIIAISVIEAAFTGGFVYFATTWYGLDWRVCIFLSVISMSTAPAATMMVMRELKSSGPLTDAITAVVAFNKIIVLLAFTVATAYVGMYRPEVEHEGAMQLLFESGFTLYWEIFGSAAVGYLIGLLLSFWEKAMDEVGERQILMVGAILMVVGASQVLHVSPLISALVAGSTLANLTPRVEMLGDVIRGLDPPLYAIFFVLAGAAVQLDVLRELGVVGVIFILARMAGKIGGMAAGARFAGMDPVVIRFLGLSMLALADLAIGLSHEISRRYPEIESTVATIVLGAVTIYEFVGPLATRLSLIRAREVSTA